MIETVLRSHFSRYPEMRVEDVYKLLHQGVMGSEHAVSNPESARNWLIRELAEMGAGPDEPLVDPLSPGGEIMRVHLRPFVAARHDPDELLEVFIRTANEYHGDIHVLEGFWQTASGLARFPAAEMEDFFRSMKENKYPAVHHSPTYEQLYRPAYRVVARGFCPDSWL